MLSSPCFSVRQRTLCVCTAIAAVLLVFGVSRSSGHEVAKEIFEAAEILIKSLDDKQRTVLVRPFDHELRTDWQFVPMERTGLSFAKLKPHQSLLALSLLQTPLSHRGFSQSLQIMTLEQVLHDLEKQNPNRDAEKYHLFFFGEPSTTKTWGWRIEGHHLSLSFTLVDGQTVVSTPAFLGTSPAEVREGSQTGMRVLGKEEDLARQLVKNLSSDQKKIAVTNETAPPDVINGPGRPASPLSPVGISAKNLTEPQQQMLRGLIRMYIDKLRPELAEQDWEKIEAAGFEKIHFAWSGQLMPGKPHYYCLQGPTFIIEYDNTQNNANHVHTVWRDFMNDFGADLLKQHYESAPHQESVK